MSIIKQIVFLKDKSGIFKLRDDIKSFGYDERSGQYYVQFKKGENYLHYNPANVDVANFSRQLEPPSSRHAYHSCEQGGLSSEG